MVNGLVEAGITWEQVLAAEAWAPALRDYPPVTEGAGMVETAIVLPGATRKGRETIIISAVSTLGREKIIENIILPTACIFQMPTYIVPTPNSFTVAAIILAYKLRQFFPLRIRR